MKTGLTEEPVLCVRSKDFFQDLAGVLMQTIAIDINDPHMGSLIETHLSQIKDGNRRKE